MAHNTKCITYKCTGIYMFTNMYNEKKAITSSYTVLHTKKLNLNMYCVKNMRCDQKVLSVSDVKEKKLW